MPIVKWLQSFETVVVDMSLMLQVGVPCHPRSRSS